MLEINLLPPEQKKKRMELPDIPFIAIIISVLGIIIAIHLVLSLTSGLRAMALKRLEKRYQVVLPDKKVAEQLEFELVGMKTKIETVDALINNRMSWARKLSDLCDAMIPGVWLNRLYLADKKLYLNGSAVAVGEEGTATIGRFIRSLKNNSGFFANFSEIESTSIQRTKMKDIEVMDFELICYFK